MTAPRRGAAAIRSRSAGRATIRDVAATAGVSKSLVSLVFSDPGRVSPTRRQMVLDAADTLGFRPNWAARSLAAEHANFVGILVADLHNPSFVDIVDAARAQLDSAGVYALLTGAAIRGSGSRQLDRRLVDALGDLRARSLMVVGSLPDMSPLERIATDIPLVVASGLPEKLPIACIVRSDDEEGVRMAVEHLADLGHDRLAFVGSHCGSISVLRRDAFERTTAEHDLAAKTRIETCDGTQAGGYEAAKKLLKGRWKPTAVVAVNDDVAIGVMAAASDVGLMIPRDVSVIGYDGLPWGGLPQVGLTTIDPGNAAIGRKAATWLLREIAGQPRRPEEYLVQPRLVERRTTGPVG
jgi:DNA-binding LacI/PurR family transcriptional regulator